MQRIIVRFAIISISIQILCPSFLLAQIGWGPAVNCGPNINSSNIENGHCLSWDSTQFYISSDRPGGINGSSDIWMSTYAGGWQPAVNLGDSVNTGDYDCEPFINRDGSKLYFSSYRPDGLGNADIWVSEYSDSHWRPATNLSDINTPDNEMCPYISSNGKHLYFASDRSGGLGSIDIWVSNDSAGHWQAPVNMGAVINTSGYDYSPCLTPDSSSLYFASARSGGYGALDIWWSAKAGGAWQTPMNAGSFVNTAASEVYPCVSSNKMKLYFDSQRSGGYGDYDIWVSQWYGDVEEAKGSTAIAAKRVVPAIIAKMPPLPGDKNYKVISITGRAVPVNDIGAGVYFLEQDGTIVQKFILIK